MTLASFSLSLLGACGSAADSAASSSGDGGPTPVACEAAEVGDPCGAEGESCLWFGYDCDDIYGVCSASIWGVRQEPVGLCPDEPPAPGARCDAASLCSPGGSPGACGYAGGTAQCVGWWWAYADVPVGDCGARATAAACASDAYCMWTTDCESGLARCVPSLPCGALSGWYGDAAVCGAGTTCQPVLLDPQDLGAGNCVAPVAVDLCLPAL